jgi:hypothetical protein
VKRGTINHPKVDALMAALGKDRPFVIGILTMLWDFCGSYSPDGTIGRYDDAAIARAVEWKNDPTALITALVKTRWLDRTTKAQGRLVVHDWFDHCEEYVVKKLQRDGVVIPPRKRRDAVATPARQHPNGGGTTLPCPSHSHSQYPSPCPSPSRCRCRVRRGGWGFFTKGWGGWGWADGTSDE